MTTMTIIIIIIMTLPEDELPVEEDTDMDFAEDRLVLLSLPVRETFLTELSWKLLEILGTNESSAHVFSPRVCQSSAFHRSAAAPAAPGNTAHIHKTGQTQNLRHQHTHHLQQQHLLLLLLLVQQVPLVSLMKLQTNTTHPGEQQPWRRRLCRSAVRDLDPYRLRQVQFVQFQHCLKV